MIKTFGFWLLVLVLLLLAVLWYFRSRGVAGRAPGQGSILKWGGSSSGGNSGSLLGMLNKFLGDRLDNATSMLGDTNSQSGGSPSVIIDV